MSRNTMEAWIPEEDDSEVIARVNATSAVERLARRVPMSSDVKNEPRSAGVGVAAVAKGGTYSEDTSTNDAVTLTAVKIGKAIRIAEEDMEDSLVDVVAAKQKDWATSYAKFLDNACLGVTAAGNGTTVPFTSVHKALSTTNSATGYTGGDNIDSGSGPTFAALSTTLGYLEAGDYFAPDEVVVIAHPTFRAVLRSIEDTNGNLVFADGGALAPDRLFGHEIVWATGCKTSALATDAPEGNAMIVFANRNYLVLGTRSGPESVLIDGRDGLGGLTDESILKLRARRGFAVGHEKAFSAYVKTS